MAKKKCTKAAQAIVAMQKNQEILRIKEKSFLHIEVFFQPHVQVAFL